MRDFILSYAPVIVWVIAVVELLTGILLLTLLKNKGFKQMRLLMALLCFGLFYDAFIIAIGNFLPLEPLKFLSRFRFVASGLLIPTLFTTSAYSVSFKGKKLKAAGIITVVLMIMGLAYAFVTDLEVENAAGLVRYASSDLTPKWAKGINGLLTAGSAVPVLIAGVMLIVRQKNFFMLLAGLFMFIFSAIGPATGNADLMVFFSMFGEALMVIFFALFAATGKEK
ncbi:MAG: hypothetical protein K6B75_07860 [Lachnospiraceae bacterium]|nr:hypothetical protein [Lachnospiraceae bacterium]